MFVGMTSRGWSSTGKDPYGLQRLVWTGKVPFEIKTVKAKPDGFELEFTMPINTDAAKNLDAYKMSSFNYKYHHNYGSPVIELEELAIKGAVVSEDGLKVRLVVEGLKEGYIHEINAEGIKSETGMDLLHSVGYYTLNQIPEGAKADLSDNTKKAPANNHMNHQTTNVPSGGSPASANKNSSKRITSMPKTWTNGPDQTIIMGTEAGLQYDLKNFEVKAGSKVKITFNNNDDMLHNLVIVMPNSANEVGETAMKMGLEGSQNNYIPESDKILFHTNVLSPETSESIYFEVPSVPGDYSYVCTFPGHYFVMQGIMKVTK
jgi:azurin